MRIKLIAGKQKEIIDSLKGNYSWMELSKLLDVSEGYLRNELRKEQRLLPQDVYNKICQILKKDFDNFIIEKLADNWGQSKGGTLSTGKTKEINIPVNSAELAEFYGIMLGDGNSHRTKSYKKGTYMIRIVGDSRHDKSYLENYVKLLIERLFDVKVRVGKFKPKNDFANSQNGMFIEAHSVKLVNFLEERGFPPGNKIKNKLRIPLWIKRNPKFLSVCLRGLYDTDGSVYKITNQNSHQFCFTNYNQGLLGDVKNGLLPLGINCSKISKRKDIYITKKLELRKFLKEVGFSNDRHLKKVRMWNLDSPVV